MATRSRDFIVNVSADIFPNTPWSLFRSYTDMVGRSANELLVSLNMSKHCNLHRNLSLISLAVAVLRASAVDFSNRLESTIGYPF